MDSFLSMPLTLSHIEMISFLTPLLICAFTQTFTQLCLTALMILLDPSAVLGNGMGMDTTWIQVWVALCHTHTHAVGLLPHMVISIRMTLSD